LFYSDKMNSALYETLSEGERKSPDQPLFLDPNGLNISYKTFFKNVAKASCLLRHFDILPGDCVAVLAHKSLSVIEIYLACIRLGAVFLPINPAYTDFEVEFFLHDAKPKLLIATNKRVESLSHKLSSEAKTKTLILNSDESGSFNELRQTVPGHAKSASLSENSIAALLYTSGTTGKPKGVQLSYKALLSNALALNSLWRFNAEDTLLHILPLYHLHGLFVAINVSLLSRGRIMFIRQFDTDDIISQLTQCTAMMGVPTHYTRLLENAKLEELSFDHFRLFISGSAPLLAETHHLWKQKTGHVIVERYGMTEANILTSNPIEGKQLVGSVGLPLPGVDLRIRDPLENCIARPNQIGAIEVKSPSLFSGYLNNSELTQKEFTEDGYFITGDLGSVNDDGLLTLEGRSRDLIITGGLNVYPKELETVLDSLPEVKESAIVGVPHPDFGEGVIAVVVKEENFSISSDKLINFLRNRLANYKCPKAVFFVDRLPRNSMLKVQKSTLRERYQFTFT